MSEGDSSASGSTSTESSGSASSSAESRELLDIIANLRLEVENLKRQNTNTQSTMPQSTTMPTNSTGNSSVTSNANVNTCNTSPGVFYVARDRKIKPFTGRSNDDRTVKNFIEEVQTAIQVRQIPVVGQSAFIVSLLEGPAKEEVKLRRAEKADAQTLVALLQDAFGEKRSSTQLLRSFYDRHQKDDETLRAFSHGLSELMDKVMLKSPSSVTNRDATLRDQFADNVKDLHLKRELKRLVRTNPSCTFLEIREEAIRWSEEEEREFKQSAAPETMATTEAQEAQDSPMPNVFLKALEEQRKAMEKMAVALTSLQQPQRRPPQQGKKVVCYNCGKEGHIARNCRSKRNNTAQKSQDDKKATNNEQASNQHPLLS